MTTTHLVLRYAHISMGMLALVSGAAAMTFRKGSPRHRWSGTVFFAAMLIMAATGTGISIFITPIMANVMGGSLAFYLTATGWAAAWRRPATTGGLEIGAALLGLATTIAGITFGVLAGREPNGRLHGSPPAFYFVFASVALLGTTLDVRMIARGGLTGAARTTRHLWRMSAALFMATSSFFLGQAKLFPPDVRQSGILRVPVLLVVGALLYWLIRVRVAPSIRRAWRLRTRARLPSAP
jgi:hypothetical protein